MIIRKTSEKLIQEATSMSEKMIMRGTDEDGNISDISIKTPESMADFIYSCFYGAISTINQFADKIDIDGATFVASAAEATLAAFNSDINCYLTLYIPLMDYYNNLTNVGYLMCALDSTNYTEPAFKFFDTSAEAINAFTRQALADTGALTKSDVENGMSVGKIGDTYSVSYKFNEGDFEAGTIIPITLKNKDYMVIHHHCYDGVDFDICCIGTHRDCVKFFDEIKKKATPEFDLTEYDNHEKLCLDSGSEYDVYSIVKF